jgi:hypothetical protein
MYKWGGQHARQITSTLNLGVRSFTNDTSCGTHSRARLMRARSGFQVEPDGVDEHDIADTVALRQRLSQALQSDEAMSAGFIASALLDRAKTFCAEATTFVFRLVTMVMLIHLFLRFYPQAFNRARAKVEWSQYRLRRIVERVTSERPKLLVAIPIVALMAPPAVCAAIVVMVRLVLHLLAAVVHVLGEPVLCCLIWLLDMPAFLFRTGVDNALARLADGFLSGCASSSAWRVALIGVIVAAVAALLVGRDERSAAIQHCLSIGCLQPQLRRARALADAVARSMARQPPTRMPTKFECPITYETMRDPVVAADGHSYERSAIQHWLDEHPGSVNSPMTGAPLPHRSLVPNHNLRGALEEWERILGRSP